MRKTPKQLKREGWLRQFVADGPLAKEAVEIYDLLGYEVHLKPLNRSHSKKVVLPLQRDLKGNARLCTSGLKNHRMSGKSKLTKFFILNGREVEHYDRFSKSFLDNSSSPFNTRE
jgi:hypothetical protein